ncbi:MAG: DUF2341 domain-containing protein [Gemmatimonadales bacterium]
MRTPLGIAVLMAAALATACKNSGPTTETPPPPPPPTVATVDVSPASASIVAGATRQLIATPKDASGTAVSGETVTWASGNAAVASVSSSGLVTGVAPGGPVTVTATDGSTHGTSSITVTAIPVASVGVEPPSPSIALGATSQLTATPKDASGNALTGRTITWISSNLAIASVSATGLVTAVALGGPVTITATSEGINGTASVTVVPPSFNTAWSWRRQAKITAGTANVPTGYSVAVQLDHATMVGGGHALASGNDVRVAHWTGAQWVELDRVLDNGSAWNTGTTMIWFQTQSAINANASDTTYYVYYGNPVASAGPANVDNVFLFSDDFESGNFNKWHNGGGLWSIDHSRAHGGTAAATYPAEGAAGYAIIANNLDVADVYVDAWWNINGLSNAWNVAQGLRAMSATSNKYYSLLCLCIGPSLGWNIAEYFNGVYTDITGPAGTPAANTWMRVGTAMVGTTYRVFLNGAEVREAGPLTDMTSGSIGIYKYVVPAGLQVWVDDVVARRYVFPEPTVVAGAEEAAP